MKCCCTYEPPTLRCFSCSHGHHVACDDLEPRLAPKLPERPNPARGPCSKGPRGWYCSLQEGHGGTSCPMWPTRWTRFKYWFRGHPLPR